MQENGFSVLIVDDHPIIIDSYSRAIHLYEAENESVNFFISKANDCDGAYKLIKEFSQNNKNLDIIFLDMKLPHSKDGKIISGEDLGLKINELLPATKIVVATTFNDNYRIHSILKSLNPDGFLVKNDISTNELITVIDTILNDPPYYSKTVIKLLRNEVANDFLLDHIDRKILFELSIGTRMKDLPNMLPLSIAGVEKRKRHLKNIFNINSPSDKELLDVAKEKGFI